MQNGFNLLESFRSPISFGEAVIAIGFSLLAAIVTYLMYQMFYGSRNVGAGVNRTFILGGPAITTLFLGIQSSIPLSLGLLGALSFVRFRTPVKDPAEIGFLLLLIASSIGAATRNFLVTIILFVIVFIALSVQWLIRNRLSFYTQGHIMLALDESSYSELQERLSGFLVLHLRGLRLETMSVLDTRVNLYYRYRTHKEFDMTDFTSKLNRLASPTKIEVFIG